MANREVFPGSMSPIAGDVLAAAGAQSTTVVGIQGIPVQSGTPSSGQWLQYSASVNEWVQAGNLSILVNGVQVSEDYTIFVNAKGLHNQVLINGA